MRVDKEAASKLQFFFAAEKIICEGMSEIELGIELGVSANTVKKRVYGGLWRADHHAKTDIEELYLPGYGYTDMVVSARKHKSSLLKAFKELRLEAEKKIEEYKKLKRVEFWADENGIKSRAEAKRMLVALKSVEIKTVAE